MEAGGAAFRSQSSSGLSKLERFMSCIELSGPDRVEFSPELNRLTRMGSSSELEISNADRVRNHLDSGDYPSASRYLAYLHEMDTHMIAALTEWCIHWQRFVEDRIPSLESDIKLAASELWKKNIGKNELQFITLLAIDEVLNCSTEDIQEADRIKRAQSTILSQLVAKFSEISSALSSVDPRCKALYEDYLLAVRACHDLLANYCSCISTCVLRQSGQQTAEEGIRASFESCSFHKPTWAMFSALKPELLAVVLAEHLRAHFSGPGRDGAVKIVEEVDRFRILMEPCGSGGAMRRAQSGGAMGKFEGPSSATWGLSGVPAYCAHCALNEKYSRTHYGRALWETEFNPDSSKPCCWSISKGRK